MSLLPSKDPNNIEPYFIIWCSLDNTNDGSTSDTGELQGATISTSTWTVLSGNLTVDSNNTNAVTIKGISYSANTVSTVWLSGGTANTTAKLRNRITTSDSRTLDKTISFNIEEH